MDSLYNKFVNYFKNILTSPQSRSKDEALNITINRDGYDTLVKQGRFFNNRCIG